MLDRTDRALIAALEHGLPLTARPYAEVGRAAGIGEAEVIARLKALSAAGVISRFGIVVRHRELGYRANAMVVWDVPDARVDELGRRMARFPFVTLCYRRRRRPPVWPYNLFCMIHGRDRAAVEAQIETVVRAEGLAEVPYAVLFSRRRFKQCAARYATAPEAPRAPEEAEREAAAAPEAVAGGLA